MSADWAGALELLNSFLSVFDLLLASFLRGCLVGLLSLGCSPFSLSFSGWCAGACVFRPVICFGLLCLSLFVGLFGLCAFLVVFLWCCGFVLAFGCCCFFLLGCFARFCFCCVGLLRFGPFSPGFVPSLSCPPPRLVLWCLLVQSVFCWSLPPGIWLYLRRPGCHACGVVCGDGLAPVFTSPHGNKGFGPAGIVLRRRHSGST